MYPVLFRIGTFDITSFGVMVAIGALVGLWVFRRELARTGLPPSAADAAMAGIVGGLLGAKVLWVARTSRRDAVHGLAVQPRRHELVWRARWRDRDRAPRDKHACGWA